MTRKSSQRATAVAVAILLAVGIWHLWWATRGWHITGMTGHEFRQTQTAVTVHAMKSEGLRLDYSTPILGKPWSIPFEFPLYQFVTAQVSTFFHLSEVEAGRTVSLIAFYLAIPALIMLLRAAGLSLGGACLGVIPVLMAPVYLLYSRAVLIESTAFCASAWFLYFLFRYRSGRQPVMLLATLVFGILAVLVKSTTWAVFCLPWATWVLADLWHQRRAGWRMFRVMIDDVFLLGIPLLAVGFGWVWITDRIKEMNPIAGFLTSTNLASFNFGTLAQRLDPKTWHALRTHWTVAVMPWWAFAVGIAGLILVPARSRLIFATGVFAFFVGQFVFINLYAIHDYYFYANAAGACVAVGAIVAGVWEGKDRWYRGKVPAVILLGAIGTGQFLSYQKDFFPIQVMANGGLSNLAKVVKDLVRPNEVIVMHSGDWASLLAYSSDRRMLIIPDSQMFLRPDAVRRSVALLKDESVPLVIFRGESRTHPDWLLERIKDFDLQPVPLCTTGDYTFYAARNRYRELRAILEQQQFRDINLNPIPASVKLAPAIPLAGTSAEADLVNFSPIPASGVLPYGIRIYMVDGRKMLFAHSPTVLYFPIPAGAHQVELGYRMAPDVYDKAKGTPGVDGVYIIAEVVKEDNSSVRLHEEWLNLEGDRKPRSVTLPLGSNNRGTVVLMCLPGPSDSVAYDWALFEYLRIR